jgi:hypothetical protein
MEDVPRTAGIDPSVPTASSIVPFLPAVAALLDRPFDAGASAAVDRRERFSGPFRSLKVQARVRCA